MASTYARASGKSSPARSLSSVACACRCSIWSRMVPHNASLSRAGERDSGARSAAGITGPTSSPAGISPVNGGPFTRSVHANDGFERPPFGHLACLQSEGPYPEGEIECLSYLRSALRMHVRENQVHIALLKSLKRSGYYRAVEGIATRRDLAISLPLTAPGSPGGEANH
jgi:hypothetical protein